MRVVVEELAGVNGNNIFGAFSVLCGLCSNDVEVLALADGIGKDVAAFSYPARYICQ